MGGKGHGDDMSIVYVVIEGQGDLQGALDIDDVSLHKTLESAFNGDGHLFNLRRDGAWVHEDGGTVIFEKVNIRD